MTDQQIPRRRSFLTAAAASVAGAALGVAGVPAPIRADDTRYGNVTGPDAATSQSPAEIKLGVASYSLREFPLDRALEMVRALRTPYVNFKSMHLPYEKSADELAALRKQVEGAGFTIVGGGTITFEEDTDAGVEKYFAYARAAGMPTIVCTGDPVVLPRVEKFAKRYDIKVAIHNHGPEDHHFPSPNDALTRVKGMDPRMGLCIDVGHTARTGTDVVQAVLDAGPRLHDMHIKDLADMRSRESQVAVGEGKMPVPAIFRALQTIGFSGYVNLEYEINEKDPLPGMQVSFAYMRGVLAGMASETGAKKARS